MILTSRIYIYNILYTKVIVDKTQKNTHFNKCSYVANLLNVFLLLQNIFRIFESISFICLIFHKLY